MHVVEIVGRGGLDCLQWREKPDPTPGAGEVTIDVRAAGVNFADVLARRGLYPDAPKGTFAPGYEVAGTIAAVGAGVTAFAPGDRVMALTRFGGYTTKALTTATHVARLADDWDFVKAAAMPVQYLTAYMALIWQARLQAGDKVLIHAAAGGVGNAAIQIAKHVGAEIVGTCGSAKKTEFLKHQGVAWPINYNTEAFDSFIKRQLGGVDVILDAQGGETTQRGLKVLNQGGRLVLYGIANAATGGTRNWFSFAKTILPMLLINPLGLMKNNSGIFGLNMLNAWDDQTAISKGMAWLTEAMRTGIVDPVIDATFPLQEAAKGHDRLESRANIGKVVLTVD
jgi:NADPH:quinone reductase-like Zn-dependent oxidoreductase